MREGQKRVERGNEDTEKERAKRKEKERKRKQ